MEFMKCFVFVIFMLLTLARKLSSLRLAHHHLHHDNSSPRAIKSSFIYLWTKVRKNTIINLLCGIREKKRREMRKRKESGTWWWKVCFTDLQRGTWHMISFQTRAWSWRKYHISLQRSQPPSALVLRRLPWWKSSFNLWQFWYRHCLDQHCDTCTRRSSILLAAKLKTNGTSFLSEKKAFSSLL